MRALSPLSPDCHQCPLRACRETNFVAFLTSGDTSSSRAQGTLATRCVLGLQNAWVLSIGVPAEGYARPSTMSRFEFLIRCNKQKGDG